MRMKDKVVLVTGGAAGIGLGVPMMLAFIVGLLVSNSVIIVITATGFVASQFRQRIYLAVGIVAITIFFPFTSPSGPFAVKLKRYLGWTIRSR